MEICAKTLDEGEDQQQLQKCLCFPGVLEWTEGVEEEIVGFLEQSSVEIKGEAS